MVQSPRLTVALDGPADTESIGACLAHALQKIEPAGPVLIALTGPLGAGKTTLVRSFLRALGHQGPVRSPTYTLVDVYDFKDFSVAHLDLYRLAAGDELEFLGYRDFIASGWIRLVEWPERGGRALGRADLTLALEYRDEGRQLSVEGNAGTGQEILAGLSEAISANRARFSPHI